MTKIRVSKTACAVAAGTLLAMNAFAAQPTLTETTSFQAQANASAFWTRARIAAAPALPMPVDMGSATPDAAAQNQTPNMGPAQSTFAGKPDANAIEIARSAYFQDWAKLEAEADFDTEGFQSQRITPQGTSGIYTFYDVNTQAALANIYPHIWDGKLTFSTSGGTASCSATSISNNHIVTAAHCVYDTATNTWYGNKVFTPAYRNGAAPFGTFATAGCTVLTNYVNLSGSFSINTWSQHDVAVCKVANNSAGQTINGAVGWAGRLWNAGNSQLVFNSGYPARTYTDATIATGPAQYLRACTAETFLQASETLGSGCYWGRGISGGSWLTGYKPFVVSGQVNSVNSGLYIGQQNLYGARFNSNNIVALCTSSGC